MSGEIVFPDTVNASIKPADLYSLTYPIKKAQLEAYGRDDFINRNFEKRMAALERGAPQERLQGDRVAREVVKALLAGDTWVRLGYSTTFPDIPNDYLLERMMALKHEDGLLETVFTGTCGDLGLWCFTSEVGEAGEFIRGGNEQRSGPASYYFKPNVPLRKALRYMMKPFRSEKTLYVQQMRY